MAPRGRKMSKAAVEEALANSPDTVREAAEDDAVTTAVARKRLDLKLRRDQISRAGRQMEARADATGDPFLRAVADWLKVGLRSAEMAVYHAGKEITVMPGGEFDHLGKVAKGYLMQYGDGA